MIVISVLDHEFIDEGYSVIGVADSNSNALKLIDKWFGDAYDITKTRDIRDSGVEYIYSITALDLLEKDCYYTVVTHSFKVNEI